MSLSEARKQSLWWPMRARAVLANASVELTGVVP